MHLGDTHEKRGGAGTENRRAGFTLVEMLTVIAIMMLLAGLILTGLNVARERAHQVRARRDVAQLVTAWNAYLSDYHQFPVISDNSREAGIIVTGVDVIQILRGRENFNNLNPRRIPYMDFHVSATYWNDPWGNPYRIVFDANYDQQITVHGETLRMSVVAWSLGPDGIDRTKDDVTSWRRSQ